MSNIQFPQREGYDPKRAAKNSLPAQETVKEETQAWKAPYSDRRTRFLIFLTSLGTGLLYISIAAFLAFGAALILTLAHTVKGDTGYPVAILTVLVGIAGLALTYGVNTWIEHLSETRLDG